MILASKILAVSGLFLFAAAIALVFLEAVFEVEWLHCIAMICATLSSFMFLAMLVVAFW